MVYKFKNQDLLVFSLGYIATFNYLVSLAAKQQRNNKLYK